MYTTTNESGQLNNYAKLPQMYYASYPDMWQQRHYAKLGLVATAFVGALVAIATLVSITA